MRDVQVVLELEKVIPLTVKDGEDLELKASKIIDEMIELDKKNNGFLSSFQLYREEFEEIQAEKKIFTLVKKAIDSFDPYFVHPDSYDEYNGESRRIAEKIKREMSIDEITEIMKEEFNWSFSAKFTREDFFDSAEKVHNFLKDSMDKQIVKRRGTIKKINIYVKLILHKVISVKVLENEDARSKAIEMLSGKIDTDKEKEAFLSAFNISISMLHKM